MSGNILSMMQCKEVVLPVEKEEQVVDKVMETIEMMFQKIIWRAAMKGAAIAVFLNDWDIVVGTPLFHRNEDHSDLPNGRGFFHFDIHLLNAIRWSNHIGGDRKTIYIRNIKNIKEMTDDELEDSRKYNNMAPEFARRINLSTI